MKYIVDLDSLKDCLGLLKTPTSVNGIDCVYLKDVNEMIDKFPKEEYCHEYKEALNAWRDRSEKMSQTSKDILSGKGLSKI